MSFLNLSQFLGSNPRSKRSGTGTIFWGPMFSGKTTALFRLAEILRYAVSDKQFLFLKPLRDTRTDLPPPLAINPIGTKNPKGFTKGNVKGEDIQVSSSRNLYETVDLPPCPVFPLPDDLCFPLGLDSNGQDRRLVLKKNDGYEEIKTISPSPRTHEKLHVVEESKVEGKYEPDIIAPVPILAFPEQPREEYMWLEDQEVSPSDRSDGEPLIHSRSRPCMPESFSRDWPPAPIGSPMFKANSLSPISPDSEVCESFIQTHSCKTMPALASKNLMCLVTTQWFIDARFIFIDEGQFFEDLCDFVVLAKIHRKHVFIAALNSDFKQNPFSSVSDALPKCRVEPTYGLCMECKEAPSMYTILKKGAATPEGQISIGGIEKYTPVCEDCLQLSNPVDKSYEEFLSKMNTRGDWGTNVVNSSYLSDSPRTQELLKSLTSRPKIPPRAQSGSPATINGAFDPYQHYRTDFVRYDGVGGHKTPPIRETRSVNGFGKGDGAPKRQRSQKRVTEKGVGGGQKKQHNKQHSLPINPRKKLIFGISDDK